MDINKIKNWVVKHDVEIAAGAVVVACGVACYIGYLSGEELSKYACTFQRIFRRP